MSGAQRNADSASPTMTRGFTGHEVVDDTGNQQISHLESGRRRLTVDWFERLGRALGYEPWTLVLALAAALRLVPRAHPSHRLAAK